MFAGPADNPTGFFKALPAAGTTPATFPTPTIVELIPIAPANYPATTNPFNSKTSSSAPRTSAKRS